MLANIAHELRTPLTVMRGRLEGIMDGIYPADENSIGPALEEAYLLERLVEDLRLLTMAESHQLVFEKRELDLIEIARRSISMFQPEAEEKKISLELVTSLENAFIVADPLRTEQVIGNLLSNALRYVPDGGRVWVEVLRKDNDVKININDNGSGIPEADLPFIFNRFWRGEKSRAHRLGRGRPGVGNLQATGGRTGRKHCSHQSSRWGAAGMRVHPGDQLRHKVSGPPFLAQSDKLS